jgi:putative intracellular protease/amidase
MGVLVISADDFQDGDLKAAGAGYLDQTVVSNGNLVTSPQPGDPPPFIDKILAVVRQPRTDP